MKKKCYLCNQTATSKEHVPPKCFFPTEAQYRKNLITVSSCHEHNIDTSSDDDYARDTIALSHGNNNLAHNKFLDKTYKSLIKSNKYFNEIINNPTRVYVKAGPIYEPSLRIEIDRERLDRTFKEIGYALFYKEFGRTWFSKLEIVTEFLYYKDLTIDSGSQHFLDIKNKLDLDDYKGNNPKVFTYCFYSVDSKNFNDKLLFLKFYEGFEVTIIAMDNCLKPEL